MKQLSFVGIFFLLAAAAASAQTPAPAAAAPKPGANVAVINFRKAVVESEPGLAAQKEFEKEMSSQRANFEKLDKEMTTLQTRAKDAKTDAERADLTRQIDAKQRDMTRINEDAAKMSEDLQDRLLPPIAAMVNKALDSYAMENNLAVVLDPTTDGSNVVYANDATDITSEIMRRVNAEFAKNPKAASPTATPAAPAAPAARD